MAEKHKNDAHKQIWEEQSDFYWKKESELIKVQSLKITRKKSRRYSNGMWQKKIRMR